MTEVLLYLAKEVPALVALIWIVQRFLHTLKHHMDDEKELQTQLVATTHATAHAMAANTEVLRELTAVVRSLNGSGPAGQAHRSSGRVRPEAPVSAPPQED